ncbi:pyridoxamine 5-phosphate oxidase [Bifidobacterium dentium]|uniref:Pyridoxamine 5-phosphate oxidase n=1 Tax=Bifidobacterium dentium TaxID=1689 RepID=A0A7J5TIK5_9BIFI|nr:pyridoxamine 5-phosphate oxidase [Bifidobacterium dentium]KAB7461714.1 pyridoxamine 5-phosphate oxidase [Bifidobacterium dentium]KAB7463793.1 pyridoxamine 5-phosphate oxidase [Bifidobacterium dentium]RYT65062.1 pyridoxamine 5-phosphate oxidase [Bifidobacterium dentium]
MVVSCFRSFACDWVRACAARHVPCPPHTGGFRLPAWPHIRGQPVSVAYRRLLWNVRGGPGSPV